MSHNAMQTSVFIFHLIFLNLSLLLYFKSRIVRDHIKEVVTYIGQPSYKSQAFQSEKVFGKTFMKVLVPF